MDRLLTRGHGPAVYGYGWTWFVRCLRAADAAEGLARASRMTDIRVAMYAGKDDYQRHLENYLRDVDGN